MNSTTKYIFLATWLCTLSSQAQTLDFEGGIPAGISISGNAIIIPTSVCNDLIDIMPHGGCYVLSVSTDPFDKFYKPGPMKAIFDVPGGFSRLSFFHAAKASANVVMYDGPMGTGNVIFSAALESPACEDHVVCNYINFDKEIAGGARSVVFNSVKDESLLLDDMTFTPMPNTISFSSYKNPPRNCASNLSRGNPIEPLRGIKTQTIDLGLSLGGIPLALKYDSGRVIWPSTTGDHLPNFGGGWTASWLRSVSSLNSASNTEPPFVSFRPDGREEIFLNLRPNTSPTGWAAYSGDSDFLQLIDMTTLDYRAIYEGFIERNKLANGAWRPNQFSAISGTSLFLTTSDAAHPLELGGHSVVGLPVELSDGFGRKVVLRYQLIPSNGDPYKAAKVTEMALPDGNTIQFGYSTTGKLTSITWPDRTITGLAYPNPESFLWTGVVDEAGKRFSIFKYDEAGRATGTWHAGEVDMHTVSYSAPPMLAEETFVDADSQKTISKTRLTVPEGVTLIGPNGSPTTVTATRVLEHNAPTSFSQPGGSGCSPSTSNQSFDLKGNLAWREDFNGFRTCYANDQNRNVETARVEGLGVGTACDSLLAAAATLPAGARKATTAWHPVWRKPVQVAEPRRRTTYVSGPG